LPNDSVFTETLQVKLGEPGYRVRYYAEKFKEEAELKPIDQVQRDVVSFLARHFWLVEWQYFLQ
jgi:hypothetical protein